MDKMQTKERPTMTSLEDITTTMSKALAFFCERCTKERGIHCGFCIFVPSKFEDKHKEINRRT